MVVPFKLEHVNDTDGTDIAYTADNIVSFQMDYLTHLTPMPLPQMPDDDNILIKVEGNTTTVNISWKIRNLTTSPFTGSSDTVYTSADTALEQLEVFRTKFVPITVSDSYTLTVGEEIILKGTLLKMSFTLSATSPVVWDGALQFIVGNVASSTDNLLASAPVRVSNGSGNLVINDDGVTSNPSHGISIPAIKTTSFGSDSGITGYLVKYKTSSSTGWSTASSSDITYNNSATNDQNQTVKVELSSSGTYDFRVSAKTTSNPNGNKWSPIISGVVVQ